MVSLSTEAQQYDLPGHPSTPAQARAITTHTLKGHPLRDEALLVVSELVTNAVRHSRSGRSHGLIEFAISEEPGGRIRIEVTDSGPLPSTPTRPTPPDIAPHELHGSGHGLHLVRALTQDWGADPDDDTGSCTVWALLGDGHNG